MMMRHSIKAAFLTLACGFAEPSELPAGLQYTPAPVSALVARQDVPFVIASAMKDQKLFTVLAHRKDGSQPNPVAWLTSTEQNSNRLISLKSVAAPGVERVTALEHLYALVMRQDPFARYCFSEGATACDAAKAGRNHSGVLLQIAAARQHALVESGAPLGAAKWRSITLRPTREGKDADIVSAVAFDGEKPLENVNVFFNRAPHSSCTAKTTRQGLAKCRLVDQHGDEHDPAVERATPVLAVYPGDVGPAVVRLPTTQVVRGEKQRHVPSTIRQ